MTEAEDVPLRAYIEALMAEADKRNEQRFLAQQKAVQDAMVAQEKAVTAALAAAEKAVAVAERNAEQWRAGANEWRGSMTDRERNFASQGDLKALKERMDRNEGGGKGMRDMWGWIVAGIMLLMAVLPYLLKGRM